MIKPEDVQVGAYIWWTADRPFTHWTVPGRIVEVNADRSTFRVVTFDSCDRSDELRIVEGDGVLVEMRLAEFEELRRYIFKRKQRLEADVFEKHTKWQEAIEDQKRWQADLDRLLEGTNA